MSEKRERTILRPESKTGPEIDDLLRVIAHRGNEELPVENVVDVELVLEGLTHLLNLIVGQTITVSKEGLIASVTNGRSVSEFICPHRIIKRYRREG
jgi:hypothetical protein